MKLNISEKQFDSQFLDKAVDKILAYKPGENQGHIPYFLTIKNAEHRFQNTDNKRPA